MLHNEIEIYMLSHKNFESPPVHYVKRLQLGAHYKPRWDTYLRDDEGINISENHPWYADLTGLYWIWKNTDSSFVGICHYNRFFSPINFPEKYKLGIVSVTENMAFNFLNLEPTGRVFLGDLSVADIIMAPGIDWGHSGVAHYASHSRIIDWMMMVEIVESIYPGEGKSLTNYFSTPRPLHWTSIFITRREILNGYCSWIFPIYEAIEHQIPRIERGLRIFSHMNELLINYYVASRRLNVTSRPTMYIAERKIDISPPTTPATNYENLLKYSE